MLELIWAVAHERRAPRFVRVESSMILEARVGVPRLRLSFNCHQFRFSTASLMRALGTCAQATMTGSSQRYWAFASARIFH